jgi:ArsR family transcriptional regulator
MDANTKARLKAQAGILKALAHPSRLLIIEELARQERCVQDLTDMVGAQMSTVSKHLSILKSARIVEDEKRGAQVFYSLRTPCVLNFFKCVVSVQKSAI